MRRINRNAARMETLRKAAKEAEEKWQALSPAEQLKVLDQRLGAGQGAARQRAKIAKAMAASEKAKASDQQATDAKKAAKPPKQKKQ